MKVWVSELPSDIVELLSRLVVMSAKEGAAAAIEATKSAQDAERTKRRLSLRGGGGSTPRKRWAMRGTRARSLFRGTLKNDGSERRAYRSAPDFSGGGGVDWLHRFTSAQRVHGIAPGFRYQGFISKGLVPHARKRNPLRKTPLARLGNRTLMLVGNQTMRRSKSLGHNVGVERFGPDPSRTEAKRSFEGQAHLCSAPGLSGPSIQVRGKARRRSGIFHRIACEPGWQAMSATLRSAVVRRACP